MAKKQDFDKDIHLSSFDDLFQTDESREDMKREKLMDIPISMIQDFPEHPYKVKDDENMVELVESVRTRGLIQPVLVRPLDNGMYEMVSGHRRKRAFEIAGIEKIPARVQILTRDEAILSMVDSNLQRDEILPSEKAFAFKMRLEAMKRQAGRPSKNNYSPVANNLPKTSSAELAEAVGENKDQIYRFIRLTNLIPEMLDLVDDKKIAMRPAVEISYLTPEEQLNLADAIDAEQCTPSHDQTLRMKRFSQEGKLTNENINQADNVSPEQYATDKVSDSMRVGSETAAVGTEKAVRKGVSKAKEKVKEKVAEKKAKQNADNQMEKIPADENSVPENKPEQTKNEPKKNTDNATKTKTDKGDVEVVKEKQDKTVVKEKTQAPPKTKTQPDTAVEDIKKPRQRKQTTPKTKGKGYIKKFGAEKQTVKTVNKDTNKIKQSKRSLDATTKSIKKADKTVKTAKKTVKTTASTTKKTSEVAKRTKQTAQATARVTIKTVKVAAKVVVEAGKAVVAGVKSIGAIIAGGGVPAIVIIIIICLIGAIGGTCFGIFLANDETTRTQKTMSQAISELTSEQYANLTAMKASYTYDLIEIQGDTSINWKDVLAVYAIKTTSGENPLEVVTLDDTKIDLLRGIMKDMNTMTGVVTPKVVAETTVTTDENGNSIKTTTYVTKKVLTVSILQLSIDEISTLYNFNDEQKALLEELMSDEYNDLWAELLGASGQIIQGNSSFVGTGMFTWPFENDQYISSRFGTRVDPISGEVKTHGGTDIAAPLGTPILAAADGVVVTATWHNSYGYYVKIKHDDTYSTLYAHCSALHVSVGQTVKQGQVIADCGSTGYSTGPHLHFEVIQNGVRVNALGFYK